MPLSVPTSRASIAGTSSRQPQWSPEEVLKLCLDGRCVGYAPSKRRKCRNPIRYDNVQSISSLLADMVRRQPDPELLRPALRRLAEYGLCLRYHWTQVDEMVNKWTSRMCAAFPVDIDGTQERRSVIQSRPATAAVTLSGQVDPMSGHLAQRPRPSNIITPPRNNVSRFAAAESVVAPSDISPTSSTASSPAARSADYATPRNATGSARSINRPASGTVPAGIVHPASETAPRSSATSSPNAPQVSPRPTRLRCTRPHARRLPFDDECPICYEGNPLSECDSSELVWCRSHCGRTVHKTCFDDWHVQCENDNRSLSCAVCCKDWDEHPGCDSCDVIHAQRQPIEGDCAICCDAFAQDGLAASVEGLVWCKSSCGQSVHRSCFEEWKAHCITASRDATCVACRALWHECNRS